jgi:hypothetical protein
MTLDRFALSLLHTRYRRRDRIAIENPTLSDLFKGRRNTCVVRGIDLASAMMAEEWPPFARLSAVAARTAPGLELAFPGEFRIPECRTATHQDGAPGGR